MTHDYLSSVALALVHILWPTRTMQPLPAQGTHENVPDTFPSRSHEIKIHHTDIQRRVHLLFPPKPLSIPRPKGLDPQLVTSQRDSLTDITINVDFLAN